MALPLPIENPRVPSGIPGWLLPGAGAGPASYHMSWHAIDSYAGACRGALFSTQCTHADAHCSAHSALWYCSNIDDALDSQCMLTASQQ